MTLISTVGHLHPGGLETTLKVEPAASQKTVFRSKAKYYEPRRGGLVGRRDGGDAGQLARASCSPATQLSVHATYDGAGATGTRSMGIMPVAVYNGIDVGGVDAMSRTIAQDRGADARTPAPRTTTTAAGRPAFPTRAPDRARRRRPDRDPALLLRAGRSDAGGWQRRPPTVTAGQSIPS